MLQFPRRVQLSNMTIVERSRLYSVVSQVFILPLSAQLNPAPRC
jgi:hypothetical protein